MRATNDLRGHTPESWVCVDCGFNTAPSIPTRVEMEQAFADPDRESITAKICENSEVYTVRSRVWESASMEHWPGCLCIGCLENRLGRRLKPKDFDRKHPFSLFPGTARLLSRRGQRKQAA